ncbi:homer protein homolog 1-like, partial [Engraulis encrasicolus]|uniref:homer protein homolog 1-like n=1 Tax=Engraulis encrasicolus TaxID=184585 RepID=UPI002FD12943
CASREQPIYSTRAHVFQIDPNTKKNWIPTCKHAVTVSYFYDSTRNVYRIISLDGSKALINSTISPNMTFTKTSHKFGQWADSRANTVYGLGFSSEGQLLKFAEKFAEFKEAARLAKERSQEKSEQPTTPSPEAAPVDFQSPLTPDNVNGTQDGRLTPHAPQSTDAQQLDTSIEGFPHSICTVPQHWEAERAALKGNNAKLTAALLESTANVKQWKQQLAAYQEEAERLHKRVTELECASSQSTGITIQRTELNWTIEELEAVLKSKEEELQQMRDKIQSSTHLQTQRDTVSEKLQETEFRNQELEDQVRKLQQRLESDQLQQDAFRKSLHSLLQELNSKLHELTELRDSLARLIEVRL